MLYGLSDGADLRRAVCHAFSAGATFQVWLDTFNTGDEPGHPEFDWVGRRLRVGDAVLRIEVACARCVMVTREVDDALPQDRTILRHIVKELDQSFGVYAEVETPGAVRTGDPVTLLD